MKYILITGVSTGIGYAITKHFIKEGYFVIGSVRKEKDAIKLEIDFPKQFKAIIFDVVNDESIKNAIPIVEDIVKENGLNALINNAGIAVYGPLQHLPIEKFRHQFDVNVLGVVRVTQAFLYLLGAAKESPFPKGKIFNISSVSGRITSPFLGPYASSKHAVESVTDSLRRELLIYGIDVISIQPGPVKSEIWEKVMLDDGDYSQTDYAPILTATEKIVEKTAKNAIPAVEVAKVIHRALTQKRAKTRYIVAKMPFYYKLLYLLPDRMIDKSFKKQFASVMEKSTS